LIPIAFERPNFGHSKARGNQKVFARFFQKALLSFSASHAAFTAGLTFPLVF
jgi:hypothetical protein